MSPSAYVEMASHIKRYRETGGAEGHHFNGTRCLLLDTRGRRSRLVRTVAVVYETDAAGRYIVVASKAGAPNPPDWFRNLQACPEAVIQVGAEVFPVRARVVTATERPALWQRMVAIYPPYDRYEQRAGREMPVILLERSLPLGT
ncbi:MAG: nitroreductase family deazaflavin-dependent oxidoreductase [Proteobacteria bacterium]|nr:nitroreductase family deazaflavin-dependent oxidoreductase [Pseudomonadota bacterium]HQR02783.1 nitroreductase family deazaflavin-dependent oxidoreductase [Rhodocyclaceae bacterium]